MRDGASASLRPRWELPTHVAALLVLNLAAGIAAKLLALHLREPWSGVPLAALLACCFGARLYVWLRLGRYWQLSFVYPLLSLNYPLAGVVGYLVFAEAMTFGRVAGLLLIAVGVVLASSSANRYDRGVAPRGAGAGATP